MKNYFSTVSKLVAAAICALSLGSCSRAEYAMLPKGGSYHGVVRAATPVPAPVAVVAAPAPLVAAPVASETEQSADAIAARVQAPVQATDAPAERTTNEKAANATIATTGPAAGAAVAAKPTFVQRLALSKITHKMDKLARKAGTVRSHDNAASTARGGISGNLRTGLILLLIGILVGLIPNLGLVGTIIAIIGLVFIILWLLDQA